MSNRISIHYPLDSVTWKFRDVERFPKDSRLLTRKLPRVQSHDFVAFPTTFRRSASLGFGNWRNIDLNHYWFISLLTFSRDCRDLGDAKKTGRGCPSGLRLLREPVSYQEWNWKWLAMLQGLPQSAGPPALPAGRSPRPIRKLLEGMPGGCAYASSGKLDARNMKNQEQPEQWSLRGDQ